MNSSCEHPVRSEWPHLFVSHHELTLSMQQWIESWPVLSSQMWDLRDCTNVPQLTHRELTSHLPMACLATSGLYCSFYFRSHNPKQWSTFKKISTNKRINLKYNQQHTPFVDWSNWQRGVCSSQVILAWKTISCQTEKGNRVKHRQILPGNWGGGCCCSNLFWCHSKIV